MRSEPSARAWACPCSRRRFSRPMGALCCVRRMGWSMTPMLCRSQANEYFVVFFCSVLFNVAFWPMALLEAWRGKVTLNMLLFRGHYKLVLIGLFDALNGILVVYASSLDRVPGPLQAILVQTFIPFSLLFSFLILRKTYSWLQIVS